MNAPAGERPGVVPVPGSASSRPTVVKSRLRVMMVDDEESLVWSLARHLDRMRPEWSFEGFTKPLLAIEQIRIAPPDVLITDIRMPGMSGSELLVAARAVAPTLPVIVVTAYGSNEALAAIRLRTGVEYLEKPVKLDELVALVERMHARPEGFSGAISLPMLPDLLQIYTLSLATGALTLNQGSRSGTIWFDRGEIVHASCGAITSDEAVYELLSWQGGNFLLDSRARAPERSITTGWQHLLLEGCRRLDEAERDDRADADLVLDGEMSAPAAEVAAPRGDAATRDESRVKVLDLLIAEVPDVLAAARLDPHTGHVVAIAGASGGQQGTVLAGEALSELLALHQSGGLADLEGAWFTLSDQFHFLQRGRSGEVVFVATSRGPMVNPAAVRSAIVRGLADSV